MPPCVLVGARRDAAIVASVTALEGVASARGEWSRLACACACLWRRWKGKEWKHRGPLHPLLLRRRPQAVDRRIECGDRGMGRAGTSFRHSSSPAFSLTRTPWPPPVWRQTVL
jgi:hypothetical protein